MSKSKNQACPFNLHILGPDDIIPHAEEITAKLRAGCKMTVDTGTFKTASLPTIEVKVAAFSNKWMPLKMPEGNWYFKSVAERDATLTKIEKSLNAPHEPRRE
jgi:hypothetical protein